jgi:hypothetical protein
VAYKDGQKIIQEEDLNFSGKITARYFFKDGQVIRQEQVAEEEPKWSSQPFSPVQDEVSRMIAETSVKEQERKTAVK